MRYSIEPRDRKYVKGYGFLSFAKSMGKNLSNKYGQKLLVSAKTAIQKIAEATGDLIGNKTADKIRSVSKKIATELHSKELTNNNEDVEIAIPKKRYISPEE